MTDRERIEAVLAKLPNRGQKVLRLRFGFDGQRLMLQEVGGILSPEGGGVGVCMERVRQI